MHRLILYILLLIQFSIVVPVLAQQEKVVVKDFSNEWKVKVKGKPHWQLPLDSTEMFVSLYFDLDMSEMKGLQLQAKVPAQSVFYVNNLVIDQFLTDTVLLVNSEFFEKWLTNEDSQLRVMLYNRDRLNEAHIKLLAPIVVVVSQEQQKIRLVARDYIKQSRNYIIVFSVLCLLFLIVLSVSQPKRMADYFNYGKYYNTRFIDDRVLKIRILSVDNLPFHFFNAFLLASFIGLLLSTGFDRHTNFEGWESNYFSDFLFWWGITFLIVLFVFAGKLILVYFTSVLFAAPISNIHYYYIVQNSLLHFFPLGIVLVLLYFSMEDLPYWTHIFTVIIVSLIYIIRFFVLYFKILRLSGFTILHLFSYFCTTELVPIIIGLKIIFF